jgi:hypothetical protein
MKLRPLHTPINDAPMPTPKWVDRTRRYIDHAASGRATAYLNAGCGQNARSLGAVAVMVEPDAHVCNQLKSEAFRGQAHWARLHELPPHERRRVIKEHPYDNTRFVCAPASASTLRAGAFGSVIIDRVQQERDPGVVIAEARRLTDGDGRAILIGYGRPRFSDPTLDGLVGDFWKVLQPLQRGFERQLSANFAAMDLALTPVARVPYAHLSGATLSVAELLRWIDAMPSMRALEKLDGPLTFNSFTYALRRYWRGSQRLPVMFETGVRVGVPV